MGTSSHNVPDANVSSVDSTAISANLNSHSVRAEITSANFMRDMKFSSVKIDTGVSNTLVTTVNQDVACCSNVKANVCVSSNSGFQAHNEFVTSVYARPTTSSTIIEPRNVRASIYCNNSNNACYQSEFRPIYSNVQQTMPLTRLAERFMPQSTNNEATRTHFNSGGFFNPERNYGDRVGSLRSITAVRPPPRFMPFSYLSYDELCLLKPEFKKFNGNPLEFKIFLSSFETYIEPRVHDKKMLFCLLLQHCEDRVRLKIEHFGERDEQAYELAKERLKREFGRSCIIADLCKQQLKDAPQVKSNNSASLKSYSELLEKTLSLSQPYKTCIIMAVLIPLIARRSW